MAQGTLEFGQLAQGKKARREAWKKGEYIFIQTGDSFPAINGDGKEGMVTINDQINKRLPDGTFGVYCPTQQDLLAKDWTYLDDVPDTSGCTDELQPYVAVEIVRAKPINKWRYRSLNGEECGCCDEDGYEVESVNGCSWMPKEVFESRYRKLSSGEATLFIDLPF